MSIIKSVKGFCEFHDEIFYTIKIIILLAILMIIPILTLTTLNEIEGMKAIYPKIEEFI